MYHKNFSRKPRRSRRFGAYINPSLYVKKAEEFTKIIESKPLHNFEDFHFNSQLLANIKANSFSKPTPIQDKLIPSILEGRDVLGVANTGTGKTAAFALPLIDAIIKNPRKKISFFNRSGFLPTLTP